jgi:Tfp pilus assembly protein PilF
MDGCTTMAASKTSIDKAIATDPTYAPAYKALAAYDIRYQQNAKATQDLINYTKYADEDPYTQLEIAKLYFTNEDYANSKRYWIRFLIKSMILLSLN